MRYNTINWIESKKTRSKKHPFISRPSDEYEIIIHINSKDEDERLFGKKLIRQLTKFCKDRMLQ